MMLAAFCLVYAGYACLSLAMHRHSDATFTEPLNPRHRVVLRCAGTVILALSLWACAHHYGWSYGMAEWVGMLTLAGLLLIWIQTYRPRAAMLLGLACVVAAPLLAWF